MKSLLRYPGGKTRAVKILKEYVARHYPERRTLLSPFLGGGSFELAMKDQCTIVSNDLFEPLYTFWAALQEGFSEEVATHVQRHMPVTKEKFLHFRKHIGEIADRNERAAVYYIINRCSFSGATFCGGFSQQAADGRLNAAALQRLRDFDLSTGFTVSNMDAVEFLSCHPEDATAFVYADPPYYVDGYLYGRDGDLHKAFDHAAFAASIRQRSDWMISYNDCPYVRDLYRGCRIFEASWTYGMNASRESSEIIILPGLETETTAVAEAQATIEEEELAA
jgi:DNA adenine methylase